MGQAKLRGTPQERRELAIAWDEAHREDRKRFPPPPPPLRKPTRGDAWIAMATLSALAMRRHA